jgi:hypothetical protein
MPEADRVAAPANRARWERHQALIADLDQRALAHHGDVQALTDEAVALVARTLEVDLVAIGELLPDAPALLIRAGGSRSACSAPTSSRTALRHHVVELRDAPRDR